jgi:hypothetical protein
MGKSGVESNNVISKGVERIRPLCRSRDCELRLMLKMALPIAKLSFQIERDQAATPDQDVLRYLREREEDTNLGRHRQKTAEIAAVTL